MTAKIAGTNSEAMSKSCYVWSMNSVKNLREAISADRRRISCNSRKLQVISPEKDAFASRWNKSALLIMLTSFSLPSVHNMDCLRAMLVHQLLHFLGTSDGWSLLKEMRPVLEGYSIQLDCQQLKEGCQSADLAAALEMQPLEGLSCIQAAIHEVHIIVCQLLAHLSIIKTWNAV